jgi:hypothetical protein
MQESNLEQLHISQQQQPRRRWWRIFPPVLLVCLAVSGLVFGYAYNYANVKVEKQIKKPPPPQPPPRRNPYGRRMPPPPPPKPRTVTVTETIKEPEYAIVLEATRGGLILLDSGTFKRSYSGAPPSGCPT